MKKKQLFQYYVLLHKYETINGKEEYKDSEIIMEPKTALAKTESELLFHITREIPSQFADKPDNVEIVISPF